MTPLVFRLLSSFGSFLLAVLFAFWVSSPLTAQEDPWFALDDDELLGVPDTEKSEFLKRFTASYGVLSAKEPELSEVEVALLEKLGPVFERNAQLAQTMLEGMLAEDTPVSATFNYILANIYYSQDKFEEAEREYGVALKKFPDFRRALTNFGILLMKQERFEEARDKFNRAVVLGEQDPFLYGLLGYTLIKMQRFRAAELAYNYAVLHEPDNPEWLEGLAKTFIDTKQYAEASVILEDLIRLNPEKPIYWKLQANAFLGLEDNIASARNLEILRAMGEADPQSLYLLGNIYAKAGATGSALDAYVEAIESSNGEFIQAALAAVNFFIQEARLEEAESLLDTLDGDRGVWSRSDVIEYRQMTAKLAMAQNLSDKAAGELESILEEDPFNGPSLIALAEIYGESEDPARAYILLDRALKIDNQEFNATLLYSKTLIREERYEEALPYLRKALTFDNAPAIEDLYLRVQSLVQNQALN